MINISENQLPKQIVQEINLIISKNPDFIINIEELLFALDVKTKIEKIKYLSNIANDLPEDLKKIWSAVLLEEAKKMKKET